MPIALNLSNMDIDLLKEVKEKIILHWNYRNFRLFPEELLEGKHLEEIYLKWNHIHRLPKWLGQLRNLTNLYLCGNDLKLLPDEISDLKALLCLDVAFNDLSLLPSSIGRLSCLNVLNASENCLAYLPDEIGKLASLQVLILSGNKLTCLPNTVCFCHDLEEICLDNNFLTHLPQQIVYLPNLRFMSVTHNQIHYLPALPFVSSPQLRFEENPFLNYLPYYLGTQMSCNENHLNNDTWALDTSGCFISNAENNIFSRNIIIECIEFYLNNGDKARLILPKDLTVCQPFQKYKNVPSMYELAIRKVYQSLYDHKILTLHCNGNQKFLMVRERRFCWEVGSIPKGIDILLSNGPMTMCSNSDCNSPIFSYALLCLVRKFVVNRYGNMNEILSALFFCTESCVLQYHIHDDSLLTKVEWQHKIDE